MFSEKLRSLAQKNKKGNPKVSKRSDYCIKVPQNVKLVVF